MYDYFILFYRVFFFQPDNVENSLNPQYGSKIFPEDFFCLGSDLAMFSFSNHPKFDFGYRKISYGL